GINDVSFHGSNQIVTPNIDALAYNGIILNKYYVPNLCTPSRATLLTGKYPIHTGMQHFVAVPDEPWGLPLTERLMPQFFREAGYATHLIGKWHLGFWRKDQTPTMRGFDHHYGYYNGYIDYYDHTHNMLYKNYTVGVDFRQDLQRWPKDNGTYATEAFTSQARHIIEQHDQSRPLFMVLSHLAVHTGNEDKPMQAPPEEVAKFAHISDPKRRIYAGMVSSLDKSVGQTISALADKGMLEHSIVLLYSDNGAPTLGIHSNSGSNYPYRGQKESPWEGGIRSAGAIWSPLLQQQRYVSNQPIHAIDWLPTLSAAAGISLPAELQLDGVNVWDVLSGNLEPQSRRLIHVLDDVFGYASYMRDNLKYVNGSRFEGRFDNWLGELPEHETDPQSEFYAQLVLASEVNQQLGSKALNEKHIQLLRAAATQRCPNNAENKTQTAYQCNPLLAACYFNLAKDPCEHYNLAEVYPLQLQLLAQEVDEYRRGAKSSARVPRADDRANPALHGGHWEWWNETAPTSSGAQPSKSNIFSWSWQCVKTLVQTYF
ncbi:CG7402, partial [Drosophila busckii]